jgi:CysZ protein
VFDAYLKAIGQLSDPAVRRVAWSSIGIASAVLILLWTVTGSVLANTVFSEYTWFEWVVDVLGGVTTLVLTWLLFPGIVSAVTGVLLERVATAVEARYYPHLTPACGASVLSGAISALRFLAVVGVVNLGLLIFLFLPLVFPFVFCSANGYLLSREYFELVALRRTSRDTARALRRAHRGTLFATGVIAAFALSVPVANLLAPVVVTATMVHLFEMWRAKDRNA